MRVNRYGVQQLAAAFASGACSALYLPKHGSENKTQASLRTPKRCGFTLLEMMIAIVILLIALTVAWQTFAAATRAWTGSRELLDRMHHGDFVLTRLSSSMRSMAFFKDNAEKFGFRMDRSSGGETISWVTASSAFIPHGSPYEQGMHRIQVGTGRDEEGNKGLLVTVWPHLADEEEVEKTSWVVSENVVDFSCKVWQPEDEKWDDRWEQSNSIPGLVEITLSTEPIHEDDRPLEIRQLIEIPLGPRVTNDISEAR